MVSHDDDSVVPADFGSRAERAPLGQDRVVEILAGRIILRPVNPAATHAFYRDTLGLAVSREFGPADAPGVVYFAGQNLIEVSGKSSDSVPAVAAVARSTAPTPPSAGVAIWLQVRDLAEQHEQLRAAGVTILRGPREEPWGLIEMWIADPDGLPIVLVEVPSDHPLRRDSRKIEM